MVDHRCNVDQTVILFHFNNSKNRINQTIFMSKQSDVKKKSDKTPPSKTKKEKKLDKQTKKTEKKWRLE